jgi:hypothetical protein
LLGSDGELILNKAVELAKKGNIHAIKLCLERIIPPARERCINLEVRAVGNKQELPIAIPDVLAAVAQGRITPAEGQALAATVMSHVHVIEKHELTRRVQALEEQLEEKFDAMKQFHCDRDQIIQMVKYEPRGTDQKA